MRSRDVLSNDSGCELGTKRVGEERYRTNRHKKVMYYMDTSSME